MVLHTPERKNSDNAPARAVARKGRADEKDLALGHKLRGLRKAQRLTLHEMARLFGISAQQVQKYETGEDRLSAVRLLELLKLFPQDVKTFLDDVFYSPLAAATGMAEETDAYLAPPPSDTLGLDEKRLLDLFRRIEDPNARENVLQLISNLADARR